MVNIRRVEIMGSGDNKDHMEIQDNISKPLAHLLSHQLQTALIMALLRRALHTIIKEAVGAEVGAITGMYCCRLECHILIYY